MYEGYVYLHRKLLVSDLWTECTDNDLRLAITCLLLVNWKDKKAKDGTIIKRGKFMTSIDKLSYKSRLSGQSVRTALKHLENIDFLTNKSTNKNRIITLINFNGYQNKEEDNNKLANRQPTDNQQATNRQPTTTNKDKKVNKDNNVKTNTVSAHPPYQQFIDNYNSICKSLPKVISLTQKRKDRIKNRWVHNPDMAYWIDVFNTCEASPFLKGESKGGWKADLDWIIKNEDNHIKVLEGAYKQGYPQMSDKTVKLKNFLERGKDE